MKKTKTSKKVINSKEKSIPNLDPFFFIPMPSGVNLTASDIDEKPYKYHPWIYAACRAISFNLMHLDRYLYNTNDSDVKIEEHPILDVLANPNPLMSKTAFYQAMMLSLLLPSSQDKGGQVFIIGFNAKGEKTNFQRGDIPTTLIPYTDQYFSADKKHITTSSVTWIYDPPKSSDQQKEVYSDEEVIRINLYNPYDWTKGLPPYKPAQTTVSQDISSTIYNTKFFDNDATLAGLLTTEQHLTEDELNIYLKKWYERYGGPGNTNKTGMIGGGLKYQQFGSKHADMQFQEQKEWNLEQILAVYGLNKIAVGMYENINFATIREGRKLLWQDTYIPLDTILIKGLNDQWIRFVDPKLRLKTDFSTISSLQDDYKERSNAAGVMTEKLKFPATLSARINNIPITEQDIIDYPWLSEEPKQQQAPQIGNPIPEEKPKKRTINTTKANKILSDEKIQRSWDYIHKILDPSESRYKAMFRRFFESQRNRMQNKVDEWLQKQTKSKTVFKILIMTPNEFLLNPTEEDEKLERLMKPLIAAQLKRETLQLSGELGGLIEWNVTNETIEEFVKARQNEIKEINTTTFKKSHKKIGDAINKAIKQNFTPQQAAKLVKGAISDVGEVRKNQAQTIARTETGIISSTTRYKAFAVEGIEKVEWLTAGDELVRKTHRIAGASQPISYGQRFPGTNMRYPLDPSGDVGEIVNCRCALIAAQP